MNLKKGAHVGADGRWIAIPIRWSPSGMSLRRALIVQGFIVIGLIVLGFLPSGPSSGSGSSILLWAGLGLLIGGAAVAALSFCNTIVMSFVRRRWPKFDGRVLPIRATASVTRVPLSERRPSNSDIKAAEHRARSILAHPELDLGYTPWIEQEAADYRRLADEAELDELAAARGYAAWLRLSNCTGYSGLPLSSQHFEMLEERLGRPVPRLWAIDDVPLQELSTQGTKPRRRRWLTRVGKSLSESKWINAFYIPLVPLVIYGLLTKSNVIPQGTVPQGWFWPACIAIMAACAAFTVVFEARARAVVRVSDTGDVMLRRLFGGGEPIALDPSSYRALVFRKHPDREIHITDASGLTKPIWRFMADSSDLCVEIHDFDPRGTPWWPLVQELESAQVESRAHRAARDGGDHNTEQDP